MRSCSKIGRHESQLQLKYSWINPHDRASLELTPLQLQCYTSCHKQCYSGEGIFYSFKCVHVYLPDVSCSWSMLLGGKGTPSHQDEEWTTLERCVCVCHVPLQLGYVAKGWLLRNCCTINCNLCLVAMTF